MRKLVASLCLVTACYRTTEWGSIGEYRGHPGKTSEQRVGDEKQTAVFDEKDGLRATVTSQAQCRGMIVGDNLEEKQEATKTLAGTGMMVAGSLILGAAGAFGILAAAADANNQDVYGNPLPPRLSSSTRTGLIVGGSAAVLVAVLGIVAVIELPGEKRLSRWVPIEGNPKQVYTSDETQPCSGPPTPVAGVPVHVIVKYPKGDYGWDVPTDANGTAVIDLAAARAVAGWCGDGSVTATVLDQTWHGVVESVRAPLEQIGEPHARQLAETCSH